MCLFEFLPYHPLHHLPAAQSPKRLLGRPMGDGSGDTINLTLASEVGSKKHRRFPSPSAARQNFLCSLWMFAMHWRTTSSSCHENRNTNVGDQGLFPHAEPGSKSPLLHRCPLLWEACAFEYYIKETVLFTCLYSYSHGITENLLWGRFLCGVSGRKYIEWTLGMDLTSLRYTIHTIKVSR